MPSMHEFRGNRGNRGNQRSQPKHEFTFRYPRPPPTSERPLLRSQRQTTPELLMAPDAQDEKPGLKFAPVSNLSDSDEADMDLSSDDNEDHNDEAPPRKRRAVETANAPPPPGPKWSNPDPYTVLPPPDESQSKKVDVVKLIRKARIADNTTQPLKADPVTSNEDFISFGSLGEDEGNRNAPDDAPKGPKRHLQGNDPSLGNRKRTHDDEIKTFPKKLGKPTSRFNMDGSIIDEWRVRPYEPGTPWLAGMEATLHIGTRLHNEILDFYRWVKPQPYEHIVRMDLLSRLQSAFQNRYYGAQLHSFGSFASGVYLPTADLDLVLLSTNFMRSGRKTFGERRGQIYAYAAFLKSLDIAVPNSIETIAHARVPILKFVDKLSGLRVDLSFDNDSGLVANNTFQRWKAEYPAMPVIVSVIKQFLLLRGLNEVPTGGLGGFSITCLVMSLLQHMPHGYMESNLSTVLMNFFDFYGNTFDFEKFGIRMNPPGYFDKRVYRVYKENNNARLSIEDPNNPDNDISGGTREIALIFKSFSDAYRALMQRMACLCSQGSGQDSILGSIIEANYDEYMRQRWQLRNVFDNNTRFAPYRQPPPPPPNDPPPTAHITSPPPPPPPACDSLPAENSQTEQGPKLSKQQRKKHASRERATRLRRLRPDLPYISESISNEEALQLGGYKSQSEMDRDLIAREKSLKPAG